MASWARSWDRSPPTCFRATNAPRALFGVRLHHLDAAVERALREWEAFEALTGR